jgi:structural hemagglutinin/hemolysin toxin protein RtxA
LALTALFKLEFYVPESHLEVVKSALFDAGAGRVGAYDSCAWQTLGEGQYRPLPGSSPHQGKAGTIEKIREYKVEMVCERECASGVIAALLESHPYEEVAYSLMAIETCVSS